MRCIDYRKRPRATTRRCQDLDGSPLRNEILRDEVIGLAYAKAALSERDHAQHIV